jgi:hypothetical protein
MARPWWATDVAAAGAATWKSALVDALGFVLVVWSIPAAILVVGTPIVLVVAAAIWLMNRIL